MQRSKQQALTFLLGALLTGGALGFSADRVMLHGHAAGRPPAGVRETRQYLGDELRLSPAQRVQLDSILDARHRQITAVLHPVRPQLDSVREAARGQIRRMLTPEQRPRFEELLREMAARDSTNR